MPEHVAWSAKMLDLGPRVIRSETVAASPALAAETVIATSPALQDLSLSQGVMLSGWAAFTVGATGTACTLRIRQTSLIGTLVASSGAVTGGIAAAGLVTLDVAGTDVAAIIPGGFYVLTLQVTGGSGVSTVSAVELVGVAV